MSNEKTDHLHIRINPKVKKESIVTARLRGTTVAAMVSQFLVAETKKEKRQDPEGFAEALKAISPESGN